MKESKKIKFKRVKNKKSYLIKINGKNTSIMFNGLWSLYSGLSSAHMLLVFYYGWF